MQIKENKSMNEKVGVPSNFGLENHGLKGQKKEFWNLSPSALVEEVLFRKEGLLGDTGAVIINTQPCTGRSPNDKFIVKDSTVQNDPVYWGKTNKPITPEQFDRLYGKVTTYLQGRDVFVQDMLSGAHPDYQLPIRIITENAWQSLFAHNLFLRVPADQLHQQVPQFTLIAVPELEADTVTDGTNSGVFIVIHFGKRIVLVGGSRYAGEIKKSIFSVMNYLMPLQGVLSMHCSANLGEDGDVALFFGLSGTGRQLCHPILIAN